ncbi:hypothetical protein MMH89_02720 [Candidatus Comchoanobacter bicostacola]|uniref:Inositol-phosphate phosphatase n=1 Tax=Candidatus Comchoanobacter bicostacola TaxID=2919598 RepID=A0ABY5DJB6_9GAMM|nr:inositol monophosphatase family protein [Candidatus Comchoanobacter bicostacola]UTC24137.1 hypothetical protein MMH89_02720 [Candidatus Comchoanobacter bicostacola]
MNYNAMQNKVFKEIRACCQHLLQAYDKLGNSFIAQEKRASFTQRIDQDLQSELISILSQTYKDHVFVAEEPDENASQEMIDAEHVWVIDPIDGSHNFANHIPFFAISICYYYEGIASVAWVYDPIHDELFTAIEGRGATLNQKRIRCSLQSQPSETICGLELRKPSQINDLPSLVATQRKMGATALTLCYVASGRFDMAICERPRIWDYAAGALIAKEAGAIITNEKQQPYSEQDQFLLVGNGKLIKNTL